LLSLNKILMRPTASRGHPFSFSLGFGALSPVVKRSGREDILRVPPGSTEVKNEWSYNPISRRVFTACTKTTVHSALSLAIGLLCVLAVTLVMGSLHKAHEMRAF
jgi:hypothetical protein